MHWAGAIGLFVMLACGLLLGRPRFAQLHPQWVRPVAALGVGCLVLGLLAVLWEKIAAGELRALLYTLAGMSLWILACCALFMAWEYWQRHRRRPRLPRGIDRKTALENAPYAYAAWQGEGYRIWHIDAPDDFLAGGMESLEEVEDWILAEMLRSGLLEKAR